MHVIAENQKQDGTIRRDLDQMNLIRPNDTPTSFRPPLRITRLKHQYTEPAIDLSLFKADFADHKGLPSLDPLTGFPFIEVSSRALEEGEPIYIFGYPLQECIHGVHSAANNEATPPRDAGSVSATLLSPKVTSAIIASLDSGRASRGSIVFPPRYHIDKPVNPGNSGGPAIAPDTGKAFGFCTAFQTMLVEQTDLPFPSPPFVLVPSLYGIVQSFSSRSHRRGI